jgi:hypothetical protein
MPAQDVPDQDRCPLCGKANGCALTLPGTAGRACWCQGVRIDRQALARTAGPEARRCLCPACALACQAEHQGAD